MIETARMVLRKPGMDDFDDVAVFLQDIDVMYAWEHAFTDEEVTRWLQKNIERCERDGCGYLIAQEKETMEVLGAMGVSRNPDLDGRDCWEIGYILAKTAWGKGYAREGAVGCLRFGFEDLKQEKLYGQIRVHNLSSILVVEDIGMRRIEEYIRHYHGIDMPHAVYEMTKSEFVKRHCFT